MVESEGSEAESGFCGLSGNSTTSLSDESTGPSTPPPPSSQDDQESSTPSPPSDSENNHQFSESISQRSENTDVPEIRSSSPDVRGDCYASAGGDLRGDPQNLLQPNSSVPHTEAANGDTETPPPPSYDDSTETDGSEEQQDYSDSSDSLTQLRARRRPPVHTTTYRDPNASGAATISSADLDALVDSPGPGAAQEGEETTEVSLPPGMELLLEKYRRPLLHRIFCCGDLAVVGVSTIILVLILTYIIITAIYASFSTDFPYFQGLAHQGINGLLYDSVQYAQTIIDNGPITTVTAQTLDTGLFMAFTTNYQGKQTVMVYGPQLFSNSSYEYVSVGCLNDQLQTNGFGKQLAMGYDASVSILDDPGDWPPRIFVFVPIGPKNGPKCGGVQPYERVSTITLDECTGMDVHMQYAATDILFVQCVPKNDTGSHLLAYYIRTPSVRSLQQLSHKRRAGVLFPAKSLKNAGERDITIPSKKAQRYYYQFENQEYIPINGKAMLCAPPESRLGGGSLTCIIRNKNNTISLYSRFDSETDEQVMLLKKGIYQTPLSAHKVVLIDFNESDDVLLIQPHWSELDGTDITGSGARLLDPVSMVYDIVGLRPSSETDSAKEIFVTQYNYTSNKTVSLSDSLFRDVVLSNDSTLASFRFFPPRDNWRVGISRTGDEMAYYSYIESTDDSNQGSTLRIAPLYVQNDGTLYKPGKITTAVDGILCQTAEVVISTHVGGLVVTPIKSIGATNGINGGNSVEDGLFYDRFGRIVCRLRTEITDSVTVSITGVDQWASKVVYIQKGRYKSIDGSSYVDVQIDPLALYSVLQERDLSNRNVTISFNNKIANIGSAIKYAHCPFDCFGYGTCVPDTGADSQRFRCQCQKGSIFNNEFCSAPSVTDSSFDGLNAGYVTIPKEGLTLGTGGAFVAKGKAGVKGVIIPGPFDMSPVKQPGFFYKFSAANRWYMNQPEFKGDDGDEQIESSKDVRLVDLRRFAALERFDRELGINMFGDLQLTFLARKGTAEHMSIQALSLQTSRGQTLVGPILFGTIGSVAVIAGIVYLILRFVRMERKLNALTTLEDVQRQKARHLDRGQSKVLHTKDRKLISRAMREEFAEVERQVNEYRSKGKQEDEIWDLISFTYGEKKAQAYREYVAPKTTAELV